MRVSDYVLVQETRNAEAVSFHKAPSQRSARTNTSSMLTPVPPSRLGGFYLVAVGIGGIANILAYGIMQMEGVGGIRGWQWIFILEGILTCVVAIGAWFIILDFPDKAAKQGFLSEIEANYVLRRIELDRGDSEADPLTWAKFFKHLSDLKLWAFCTLFMSTTVPVYAFAYFTPVILVGMGRFDPRGVELRGVEKGEGEVWHRGPYGPCAPPPSPTHPSTCKTLFRSQLSLTYTQAIVQAPQTRSLRPPP